MRYLIIGLGIYGSNLALDLQNAGHEVIGADSNASVVESLKDNLSTVYHLDSTDPVSLNALPFKNVDLVIVAIGENFGASVKTVALLKQNGVRHIYARAIDPLHHAILECFDLDRIVVPEQHAAADLAREMLLGTDIASMRVTDSLFVAQFRFPKAMTGMRYSKLLAASHESTGSHRELPQLIAATRPVKATGLLNVPNVRQVSIDLTDDSQVIADGDIAVCLTTDRQLRNLSRLYRTDEA